MDDSIFIPHQSVDKQQRGPGGSDFWESFWTDFSSQTEYDTRKTKLASELTPIVNTSLANDTNLYVEVKYSEMATSKSSRPADIWSTANLQVVESTSDKVFTLAGKKEDFEKLSRLIDSADYGVAKGEVDQTRKNKNIAREVFAVSALRGKNIGLLNRVDKNVETMMSLGVTDPIKLIIEIHANHLKNEYDNLYERLSSYLGEGKVEKRLSNTLTTNLSYNADLTASEIKHLLEDEEEFNFIRLIRVAPDYILGRSVANINVEEWQINSLETNEIVGIIDSGVSSPKLRRFRHNQEKYTPTGLTEDTNHGTFVCSRVLFGDQIADIIAGNISSISPLAKYLDIQVTGINPRTGKDELEDDVLFKALDEVTQRYPEVKVFNLSISNRSQLDERYPSGLTEKLDILAREKDVLFICVTGNNTICGDADYTEIFETHQTSSYLLSPGDAISNITVGSVAGFADESSGAPEKGMPSPFTRTALLRNKVRKPDVVDLGGNYLKSSIVATLPEEYNPDEISDNKYGVISLGTTGLLKQNGTSFSAPMITRETVQLLSSIKTSGLTERMGCEGNIANLLKSLLIHSTSYNPLPNITTENLRNAFGFGQVNTKELLTPSEDKVTIVYCDKISGIQKKHKLYFELPEFVTEADLKFTFSLAFNPPVNKTHHQYNMIDVTGTVRVPYPGTDKDGNPATKYHYISPNSDWTNYTARGSGIQHFVARRARGLRNKHVEVLVQMYLFEEYENANAGRLGEIEQPYAITLTVEDMSARGQLKQHLIQSNQIEAISRVEVPIQTA